MNKSLFQPLSNTVRVVLMLSLALAFTLSTGGQAAFAFASPAAVNLGSAAHFAVLSKTGITNVSPSVITGDMGVSPITASAITGFALVADSTNVFSTSTQVTGKIYASDYAAPTPANMTTSISNMQTAYTNAAGRAPNATQLYAGDLSGRTLAPGVYKWSTGVLINTSLTLNGSATAVWIFQISGDLTLGSGAQVVLTGGALAKNIFWQVAGGAGAIIGQSAHMAGTILTAKGISMVTGATLNGRALAQTAVTLQQNTIVSPGSGTHNASTKTITSNALQDGWVLESGQGTAVGGTMNSGGGSFNVGDNVNNQQYRAILSFNTASIPDNAIITAATIRMRVGGMSLVSPFTTLGSLVVDMQNLHFGTTSALELLDFQAAALQNNVALSGPTPSASFVTIVISPSNLSNINVLGVTQFRVEFAVATNADGVANYASFYSGNAGTSLAPILKLNYFNNN